MERHIQLEGGRNFRDLGGYLTQDSQRVRWRRVFRSGLLSDISATDTQVLLDLDISTVIDLRTDSELNEKGPSPLHSHGVEYRHASFIQTLPSQRTDEEAPTIVERGSLNYLRGLERGGPAIISVLTALVESEPGTSLVFNCTAGKDRTGIVAAILLRVLGVPDETIVNDYTLTRQYHTSWRDSTEERLKERSREAGYTITRAMLDAAPETMQALLVGIDQTYGSTEGLLETLELHPSVVTELREQLLEPENLP